MVPPELIDHIIDFLHDNVVALRACSLVSPEWVASSRYHLFGQVILHHHPAYFGSSSPNSSHRLYDVLQSSPRIASYIMHVIIYSGNSREGDGEPFLTPLLRALTSLRRLDVNPEQFVRSSIIWSKGFLESIGSVVASPTFHELRLNACTFHHPLTIMHILRSCSQLKKLYLTNIGFLPGTQNLSPGSFMKHLWTEESTSNEKGRVQFLSLDHPIITACFLHPLSPMDVDDVRELTLKIYGGFSGADAKLLKSSPLLERLEIDIMTDIADDHLLDLGNNLQLKYLIIRIPVLLDRFDPLPWLLALLTSIPAGAILEDIALTVTIDLPPPYLTLPVYQESLDGWKNIDSAIAQISSLERVRLDFALDNPLEDQIVPSIIDDILSQFHDLDSRGLLYVDTCEIR